MTSQRAGRQVSMSPLRRATLGVLIAGTVLAIAAAFGPVWIVRVGVLIAIVAAVLAVWYAWAELRGARAEHRTQVTDEMRRHSEVLTDERTRNREVVATLQKHNDKGARRIAELTRQIARMRAELVTYKGDNVSLTIQVEEKDEQIMSLLRDLAAREMELRTLRHEEEQAEVLNMPRHAAVPDWDALPSAADLWADGNPPAVADLQKLAFPKSGETVARRQA